MSRSSFKASVPPTWVSPSVWRRMVDTSAARKFPFVSDIGPRYAPCRRDHCGIIGTHPEHHEDRKAGRRNKGEAIPEKRKRKRKRDLTVKQERKRDNKAVNAKLGLKIVRYEMAPSGKLAIVECGDCSGIGCEWCNNEGSVPLPRWHYRLAKRKAETKGTK